MPLMTQGTDCWNESLSLSLWSCVGTATATCRNNFSGDISFLELSEGLYRIHQAQTKHCNPCNVFSYHRMCSLTIECVLLSLYRIHQAQTKHCNPCTLIDFKLSSIRVVTFENFFCNIFFLSHCMPLIWRQCMCDNESERERERERETLLGRYVEHV